MPRSTRRAMGTTAQGSAGATAPPIRTATRMYQGRNAGVERASRDRFRAATERSSGRTTRSTKPTVKSSPCWSFKALASSLAEREPWSAAPSFAQVVARLIASSARPAGMTAAVLRSFVISRQ